MRGFQPLCACATPDFKQVAGHRRKKQRPQTLIDNGTIYVTIEVMVDTREYHDRGGDSPFREWFDRLNAAAARKVTTALYRLALERWEDYKQRKKQQREKEKEEE